ncbi:hypothetical protein [Pseudoponticoccus marisrubri]|uniref:hypothetical protein n=1 Tax=Pseudoponticoccus marisrubri TaxID=1685382 RepID=UPI0012FE1B05|nr:hypothetical protein [Pseudoponticoccus marisrubri]
MKISCFKVCSVVVLIAAFSTPALSCIDGFMTGLSDYTGGDRSGKKTFRVEEFLVICVTPKQSGYMAIYDSPAQGDFEQLYPNVMTHDQGETFSRVSGGETYCFGTSDSFPMYHPSSEGLGRGKVSVVLTASQDQQLPAEDFEIPGQRVRSGVMNRYLSIHSESQGKCTDREVKYLYYDVIQ